MKNSSKCYLKPITPLRTRAITISQKRIPLRKTLKVKKLEAQGEAKTTGTLTTKILPPLTSQLGHWKYFAGHDLQDSSFSVIFHVKICGHSLPHRLPKVYRQRFLTSDQSEYRAYEGEKDDLTLLAL